MKLSDHTNTQREVQQGKKPRPGNSYRYFRRELARLRYRVAKRGRDPVYRK